MSVPEAWQPSPLRFAQQRGLVVDEREVRCPPPQPGIDNDCCECRYPLEAHTLVLRLKVPLPGGGSDHAPPPMFYLWAHTDCAQIARNGM